MRLDVYFEFSLIQTWVSNVLKFERKLMWTSTKIHLHKGPCSASRIISGISTDLKRQKDLNVHSGLKSLTQKSWCINC